MLKKVFRSLLIYLGLIVSVYASSGLNNLNIPDSEYVNQSGKVDMRLALLMGKLSAFAYEDSLSQADEDFLSDNGFSNTQIHNFTGIELLTAKKNIVIDGVTKELILISFRGTQEPIDFITDITASKIPFSDYSNVNVHFGFHLYFHGVKNREDNIYIDSNSLSNKLANNSDKIFILTGHSLGGAVAKLYAASLRERGISKENLLVYTFGAPPVGYFSSSSESFRNRYINYKTTGMFVYEFSNYLDPIYNLNNIYFRDGSMLEHVSVLNKSFDDESNIVPYEGCKYVGTQTILNLAFLFPAINNEIAYNKYFGDMENCDYLLRPHAISRYISNIYSNIDFYQIAQDSIDEFQGSVILSDEKAEEISSLITSDEKYKKAINLNRFDSSILDEVSRKLLIQDIKSLGLEISSNSFGTEGSQVSANINNLVQAKQNKIIGLKNIIDSTQTLDFTDYSKLAWGTVLNSSTAVADILTFGTAGGVTKLAKFQVLSGKLDNLHLLLAKVKGPLKTAFEFTQSRHFIWVKTLIDQGFVLNDTLRLQMKEDEEVANFANTIIGSYTDVSGEALDLLIDKNKHKFALYFVKKLNAVASNIIKGTTKTIITDSEVKQAVDEFIASLQGFIPIYGSFYDQYQLSKKISDDIDSKPEVIKAWQDYYNENEKLLNSIRVLGDIWFNKRLDLIVNAALEKYAVIEQERIKQLIEIEESKPKIILNLPPNVTLSNYALEGDIGTQVSITLYKTAESLREFIQEVIDTNSQLVLWYYDLVTNEQKSVNVTIENYDLVFTLPATKMQLAALSYDLGGDTNKRYSHGFPDKWEVVLDKSNIITEDMIPNDYESCIQNGGTEIACKIGFHSLSKTISISTPTDIIINNGKAYVTGNNGGISILDISDVKNSKVIGTATGVSGFAYDIDIDFTKNYAYVAAQNNGLRIFDISNPENIVLLSTVESTHALGVDFSGDFVYLVDASEGLKTIDVSNVSSPTVKSVLPLGAIQPTRIFVKDNYAYISNLNKFEIVDISNSSSPTIVGQGETTDGYQGDIYMIDNQLFVSDDLGVNIFDVSDKNNPISLNKIITNDDIRSIKIKDNYLYLAGYRKFMVYDISNINNPSLVLTTDIKNGWGIDISNSYAYVSSSEITIFDISNLTNSTSYIESINNDDSVLAIQKENNYLYVASNRGGLKIYDITDFSNPTLLSTTLSGTLCRDVTVSGNYAYLRTMNDNTLKIIDISNKSQPEILSTIPLPVSYLRMQVKDNILYILDNELRIFDISNPSNPTLLYNTAFNSYYTGGFKVVGNYLYLSGLGAGLRVFDITSKSNPSLITTYAADYNENYLNDYSNDIFIKDNYAYIGTSTRIVVLDVSNVNTPQGVTTLQLNNSVSNIVYEDNRLFVNNLKNLTNTISVVDISNPEEITLITEITNSEIGTESNKNAFLIDNGNLFIAKPNDVAIYDLSTEIANRVFIENYYYPSKSISLVDESPKDYEIRTSSFTKSWTFSEDISDFIVSTVEQIGYYKYSYVKNGNSLSVYLSPSSLYPVNKLIIKLIDSNGNTVRVSGSDTFWSITKTNNAPRLADGQLTQLVGNLGETASIDINTFDADGDIVTLSVEDSAGGNVSISGNTLSASFSDNQTMHTIKVGIDDGKEKVIKDFTVLQFDTNSIKTFYSDVGTTHTYFDQIAFGTLEGIFAGQVDSTDTTKRVFRPNDEVSLAEALSMIIKAAKKIGKANLQTNANYIDVYPSWAMPYYTYARQVNAIDDIGYDLSVIYPTAQDIARILVKLLDLEEQEEVLENLTYNFTQSNKFTNASYAKYAKLVRFYGLLFTNDDFDPTVRLNRSEIANIVSKIFMIPTATIGTNPSIIEYKDNFELTISDIEAKTINSSYELINTTPTIEYAINKTILNSSIIDSSNLNVGSNTLLVLLNNNGVRNILVKDVEISFSDDDNDGIQNSVDTWSDDARYANDLNSNGIPDILDSIYNLSSYSSTDSVTIDGNIVEISKLIADGGYVTGVIDIYLALNQGWNLISLPLDTIVDLSSLNDPYIQTVRSLQNGEWKTWNINSNSNTLTNLEDGYGYWIKSSQNTSFEISGERVANQINLNQNQWNMIGSQTISDINQFFIDNPNVKVIWKYSNGEYQAISNDTNIQNDLDSKNIPHIYSIEPNEGVFIK